MENLRLSKFLRVDPPPTLEWLRKHKPLTLRERKTLISIYKHRCLTSKQIAAMHFSFTPEGSPVKNALMIAQRKLKRLYELHLIDRFFIQIDSGLGSAPQFVMLDSLGAELVEGWLGEIKWREELNKTGLQFLEHTVGINEVYVTLLEHTRQHGNQMGEFLVEANIRKNLMYKERVVHFSPDAYGEYLYYPANSTESILIPFFLEYDRGTMTLPSFAKKQFNYAAYYASDAYLEEYSGFPLILTVAPTWERARDLCEAIANKDRTDLSWLFTSEDLLAHGFLEPIWLKAHESKLVSVLDEFK